ncbi:putative hydrolase of the HAD superfamily [Rhodoferax sp. OV413]|uniref:HAD family hydrolase n=1 Tax=Rhodoferax sp. OV413 TaxID=1855285 RepID=UPI0008849275|nr:HAD-IA family hydrolase [Rhodoferax sp. OV413]SDO26427.1 putative hydrolase of the HAD superfamily [Rhodoferax sp. OV413]
MLDLSKIKAISLDLDDTLWPVWPAIERAEAELLQWLVDYAPATAARYNSTEALRGVRVQLEAERPDLRHDLSALRRESIRLALQLAGEDTDLAEPAFDVFFAARQRVDFYTDALPALEWLAARYPLVALSNGNADVHRVGIGAHFTAALSAREFGVAKPDPRIFHAAALSAGVAPHEVLHVGDDPLLDVVAAVQAGMQAVWVNRGQHAWSHAVQPHLHVAELGALCALLAQQR